MVVLVQGNQEESRSGSVMVVGLWTVALLVHWDSSKGGSPTFTEEAVAIDLISDRLPAAPPLLLCRVAMRAIVLPNAADLPRRRRSPSVAPFKRSLLIVRIMRAAAVITTTLGRINRLLSLASTPAPVVSHSIAAPPADSCHSGAQLITRIVLRQLRKTTRCGCHCIDQRN